MLNILFLPGLGCNKELFRPQVEFLKTNYLCKVVVCNKHDHMMGHVQHLLNTSTEEMVVVGHSFGGWVAQWLAIKAPEKILGLVLLGTSSGTFCPEIEAFFLEALKEVEAGKADEFFEKIYPPTVSAEHSQRLYETIRNMQKTFTKEELANQFKTDIEAKSTRLYLRKIQCPTLLINGEDDGFYDVYTKEMKTLAELIPNSFYMTIKNCGHMVSLEQPEALTAVIEFWLKTKIQASLP